MTTENTINIIEVNENGVIYVENQNGKVYGIVNGEQITDEDGLLYTESTLTVLEENFDCDINYDSEDETTTIHTECGGELVFSGYCVSFA
jgi:hypothetical protein